MTVSLRSVYQSFFIPRPIEDRHSSSPALARGNACCPDTLGAEQDNSRPAPQDHGRACTAPAPASTGNSAHPDTSNQSEVAPQPGLFYWTFTADGVFVDWSVPPAMVVPAVPINRKLCEIAASDGYAHTLDLQASLVPLGMPEGAYAAVHLSPPPVPSSHSELAHAFGGPLHCVLANASVPSKLATARSRNSSGRDAA